MFWFDRARKRRRGELLDRPLDDPESCRCCDGACCRGFASVALSWPEYERLERIGATRLHLPLLGAPLLLIDGGCEFLTGGRCGIYAERPDICRRFACRPLRN